MYRWRVTWVYNGVSYSLVTLPMDAMALDSVMDEITRLGVELVMAEPANSPMVEAYGHA